MDYCRMLLVTKSHHERDEEKAVDKNQAGDIGSVSKPLGLCMFSLVFPMDSMCTFLLKYHLWNCIWKEDFVICVICFANAQVKEHILLYQKNIKIFYTSIKAFYMNHISFSFARAKKKLCQSCEKKY